MTTILAVAGGGAAGTLLRYWCSNGVYAVLGKGFPYGTLSVNVIGSFLMGFLFILLNDKLDAAPEWKSLLLVGLLGAFTTFSTFSMDTLTLIEQGALLKAGLNILLSVSVCIIVCWLGVVLARQLPL